MCPTWELIGGCSTLLTQMSIFSRDEAGKKEVPAHPTGLTEFIKDGNRFIGLQKKEKGQPHQIVCQVAGPLLALCFHRIIEL